MSADRYHVQREVEAEAAANPPKPWVGRALRALARVFVRHVPRGSMFPRGYGRAFYSWHDMDHGCTAVLIPFNMPVGFVRWLYFACLWGPPRHANDEHFHPRRHDLCVCKRCGKALAPTKSDREAGYPLWG